MIKVIASDMDGTLLGGDHKLAPRTFETIKKAQGMGIRFMVITGRNFSGAVEELKDYDLSCDYILGSGSEVRNAQQKVESQIEISIEKCRQILEVLKPYPIALTLNGNEVDYMIGTDQEIEEGIIKVMRLFHTIPDETDVRETDLYKRIRAKGRAIKNLDVLETEQIPIFKMMCSSDDREMLDEISEKLCETGGLAIASSFPTNIEITDERAQKGPVLKSYIESLGYTMDEVMVLGDSLNDYSMLSMEFGATVVMENGDDVVKRVAKYMTKSNEAYGAAYAMEAAMDQRLDRLKKQKTAVNMR
ncbi:MAG: Cof-type HAD-IIB family hydrolase [Hespellia sp.]|nr:Cof-type HAD-IIB family hydrolase [Hespellia sp.]